MAGIPGPLLARISVTASAAGTSFASAFNALDIRPAAQVQLTVAAGYGADISFSTGGSAPKVPVPDDTSAPDNYTFYQGPAVNAPIVAFAGSDTPIEVLVYKMRF